MAKHSGKKKPDVRKQIINRQIDEIERLKKTVSELQISCEQKDEMLRSIETLRTDFVGVIDDLKAKSQKYDELIAEVYQMRNVMNQIAFKGKWKLVRLLIK